MLDSAPCFIYLLTARPWAERGSCSARVFFFLTARPWAERGSCSARVFNRAAMGRARFLLCTFFFFFRFCVTRRILGDPGAVNGGARKINRRDERFHESLQGGVKEPLGTDSHQTISKRLGECWLLIGQKIPLYYSAQSANGSF